MLLVLLVLLVVLLVLPVLLVLEHLLVRPFVCLIFCSPPLGFRHDNTEISLKIRSANVKKMKKLVIRDRLDNEEAAEAERLGGDCEEELNKQEENLKLAQQSGALSDSSAGE